MMAKVKICGLRRREDIEYANTLLPDYIGFVFANSRRRVTPDEAKILSALLDKRVGAVGVFVDEEPETVSDVAAKCGLKAVQLHGFEDAEYIKSLRRKLPRECEIWKAASVRKPEDIAAASLKYVDRLVLDAYSPDARGGTGKCFDWSVLKNTRIGLPFFVAGGINTENIGAALSAAKGNDSAFGIDVSSGVETAGQKDFQKMKKIIAAVRGFNN